MSDFESRLSHLSLRDFRNYDAAEFDLGERLTVIVGHNAAGKSSLIEALYFACHAHSPRTANDRELVRFGMSVARVELEVESSTGRHSFSAGISSKAERKLTYNGSEITRSNEVVGRPLLSTFFPDRLALVKGQPALRRAHLDQFVAALWPQRELSRRSYMQALAQRNALLSGSECRGLDDAEIAVWDRELAKYAVLLISDRRAAVELLSEPFARVASELGLEGDATVSYRARSEAATEEQFVAELQERYESDLARGFTGHGPHRDDLLLKLRGREVRKYGSQGEQRLALLSLLIGERDTLEQHTGAPPVMLLDDVMSELDSGRRERLVGLLLRGGQSVITATELEHIPLSSGDGVVKLAVADGNLLVATAMAA